MKAQIQAAKRARKSIAEVRKRLLCPTPEAVSACAEPLAEAIGCMETLQNDLKEQWGGSKIAGRVLKVEVGCLRKELSQANALLRSAAEFHEGYGRLLRSFQDAGINYSRTGSAVPAQKVRKLIVHG